MTKANLPSFGCFAHSLQLVVNDGLLFQRVVKDLLAVCRSIVGHFKHSSVCISQTGTNSGKPRSSNTQNETGCVHQMEFSTELLVHGEVNP